MLMMSDIINEESVIILSNGTVVKGAKQVAGLIIGCCEGYYKSRLNTTLKYGAIGAVIALGIIGGTILTKDKNRKKEA